MFAAIWRNRCHTKTFLKLFFYRIDMQTICTKQNGINWSFFCVNSDKLIICTIELILLCTLQHHFKTRFAFILNTFRQCFPRRTEGTCCFLLFSREEIGLDSVRSRYSLMVNSKFVNCRSRKWKIIPYKNILYFNHDST